MKKLITIILAAALFLPLGAQTRKSSSAKKATTHKTTTQKKKGGKTATAGKKSSTKKSKEPTYTNASIKGLQNERQQIQKKIKEQEQLLRANKADVKKRLSNLVALNSEIDQRKRTIETIQKDIVALDGNIELLTTQLATLEQQLQAHKQNYVKSLRYMARTRSIEEQLMFIFSAKNLTQMYRRLRFVRDYAAYQRTQGEMVKAKQAQITAKHKELEKVKGDKSNMLYKGKKEQEALQGQQAEQQKMVSSLKKQQKTIQGIIDDQKKKDAALNAQIDRLVAEEVAKAKVPLTVSLRRRAKEKVGKNRQERNRLRSC